MSVHTEWELLAIAEDIEQGDDVLVENTDTGDEIIMSYVKYANKCIYLKDADKNILKFNPETLECKEEDLNYLIVGANK
jgi:hypothetical protein